VWLVEVKATKGRYDHFGPDDRAQMIETAKEYQVEAWLAHRLPGDKIDWVPAELWPKPR
jgi:hypothetical protein